MQTRAAAAGNHTSQTKWYDKVWQCRVQALPKPNLWLLKSSGHLKHWPESRSSALFRRLLFGHGLETMSRPGKSSGGSDRSFESWGKSSCWIIPSLQQSMDFGRISRQGFPIKSNASHQPDEILQLQSSWLTLPQ